METTHIVLIVILILVLGLCAWFGQPYLERGWEWFRGKIIESGISKEALALSMAVGNWWGSMPLYIPMCPFPTLLLICRVTGLSASGATLGLMVSNPFFAALLIPYIVGGCTICGTKIPNLQKVETDVETDAWKATQSFFRSLWPRTSPGFSQAPCLWRCTTPASAASSAERCRSPRPPMRRTSRSCAAKTASRARFDRFLGRSTSFSLQLVANIGSRSAIGVMVFFPRPLATRFSLSRFSEWYCSHASSVMTFVSLVQRSCV